MDEQLVRWVLYVITAVGAVVWLCGLIALLSASRSDVVLDDPDVLDRDLGDDLASGTSRPITGAAEVEGHPGDLSTRAAAILARMGASGMVKIVERTDDRLAFEGTGLFPALGLGRRSRGVFRFQALGGQRTRITYKVRRWRGAASLIWAGALFQVLGLVGVDRRVLGDDDLCHPQPQPGHPGPGGPDAPGRPRPLATVPVRVPSPASPNVAERPARRPGS